MQGDHLKAQYKGPCVLGQLSQTHAKKIQYVHLKMGERWTNPQQIEDIIVKYDKTANVIATSPLVSLDEIKLHTVNLFLHPIGLFQVFYHASISPCVGCHRHLDIQMYPLVAIRSPIYQQSSFDTLTIM